MAGAQAISCLASSGPGHPRPLLHSRRAWPGLATRAEHWSALPAPTRRVSGSVKLPPSGHYKSLGGAARLLRMWPWKSQTSFPLHPTGQEVT